MEGIIFAVASPLVGPPPPRDHPIHASNKPASLIYLHSRPARSSARAVLRAVSGPVNKNRPSPKPPGHGPHKPDPVFLGRLGSPETALGGRENTPCKQLSFVFAEFRHLPGGLPEIYWHISAPETRRARAIEFSMEKRAATTLDTTLVRDGPTVPVESRLRPVGPRDKTANQIALVPPETRRGLLKEDLADGAPVQL